MGHLAVPELAEWELTKHALDVRLQFLKKDDRGVGDCKPALLGCACSTSKGKLLLFVFGVALNLNQLLELCCLVTVL